MRKTAFCKSVIMLLALCVLMIISGCDSEKKQDYYSQSENYINASGTIIRIAYNEDSTALYIDFSELTPEFDDTCFKLVGDNLKTARNNGIDEMLKPGDRVDFVTAPRYFGDGYVMPIVAISIDGDSLLEFEDGFEGLLAWLEAE